MRNLCARFAREDGVVTALSLFLLLAILMVGGLAIDFSNAVAARTRLQITADSAAHAALYKRELLPEDEAKAAAIELVTRNMPPESFGEALLPEDIVFGRWDRDADLFEPAPGSRQAVLVRTAQLEERQNSVTVFLLRLVGMNSWDVLAPSVFETYYPTCLREGMVGDVLVDVQSNNIYESGFCLHSNGHVSVNSNNLFEQGTVVSMPDTRDIELPKSGFESNDGLQYALRDGVYPLKILDRIDAIYNGVQSMGSAYMPDYITSDIVIDVSSNNGNFDQTMFQKGRVHRVLCKNSGANIEAGTLLSELVIVTDCDLKFGAGARLEDVVIVTRNTGAKSVYAASGLQVGRNDNCAPGGGAQIVTYGGIDIPSDLQMYGGQMIAAKDIAFTANADGIQGAAFVAGGTVSGTSNGSMAFCGGAGMENNFEAAYFRLAR
ncbi:Tad domain-containing protein [Phaeovulum sp. NW3]|uniref:Tad domain-containing protein n=1 Tax=Phaeovulum sp. NW3 TaxID=2934933 RepID=UPI0020221936|nr:Tad domain-containing protein [Phaeovulum sp. NW3]MCL7466203.1 Tad domain-containing protein [Phaeovulum sp. NW3]